MNKIKYVFFVMLIAGCGPFYKPCTADNLNEYRCNNNAVEMCYADQWVVLKECDAAHVEGVSAPMVCKPNQKGMVDCYEN